MFVDICFANNNEVEFRRISNLLGIKLIYIQAKQNKGNFSNAKSGKFSTILKEKRTLLYYYDGQIRPGFNNPNKEVTQVAFKEIKEKLFGMSLQKIISGDLEHTKFLINLAFKYKCYPFIASFAKSPWELRGEEEVLALLSLVCSKERAYLMINNLEKYLSS